MWFLRSLRSNLTLFVEKKLYLNERFRGGTCKEYMKIADIGVDYVVFEVHEIKSDIISLEKKTVSELGGSGVTYKQF